MHATQSIDVQGTDGLCFPQGPGASVDAVKLLSDHSRSTIAIGMLKNALSEFTNQNARKLIDASLESLQSVEPFTRVGMFSTPVGYLDTAIDNQHRNDGRTPSEKSLTLFRHLIGHHDAPGGVYIVTRREIGKGIYFPHLHALLKPQSHHAVAIKQSKSRLQIVRSDGLTLTVPSGYQLPVNFDHALLRTESVVGPFSILNGVPEVQEYLRDFGLASAEELRTSVTRVLGGYELLRTVWPEASDALRRHVSALVLLNSRTHARSHSPKSLCGAIVMTAGQATSVGDIFCHEASHIRMHYFKAFDPIVVAKYPDTVGEGFVSPWRPDLRPLDGLLLGVHAFLNVCGWYQRLSASEIIDAPAAKGIHDRQAANVRIAFQRLLAHGNSTNLGALLIEEFRVAVEQLPRLSTPLGKVND